MTDNKWLTADEVREFDPKRILRKHIATMQEIIVERAKAGANTAKVPFEILEDLFEKDHGVYYLINKGKGGEFATHFRKHGFGVRDYYDDGGHLVDHGVIISWEEK